MPENYTEEKIFNKVNFESDPLEKGEYENCRFVKCEFSNAGLAEYRFIDCIFENCNLSNANITLYHTKQYYFQRM